jgi:hypothetical protein
MLFGIPCTIVTSGNTFACCSPGFTNSSNDNARPTADLTFPFGGGDGDTRVVDVVCESVWVSFASVWAVDDGAELSAVGALDPSVVSEFGTEFGVCTVTGEDWIVGADMAEVGFNGLTGDIGLVGLLIDFLHVSCVVTHDPKTGCPYGLGQVEERVWVMLPV